MSNKLEQLDFKLENFFGIQKHAGKVRKIMFLHDVIHVINVPTYSVRYHCVAQVAVASKADKSNFMPLSFWSLEVSKMQLEFLNQL